LVAPRTPVTTELWTLALRSLATIDNRHVGVNDVHASKTGVFPFLARFYEVSNSKATSLALKLTLKQAARRCLE